MISCKSISTSILIGFFLFISGQASADFQNSVAVVMDNTDDDDGSTDDKLSVMGFHFLKPVDTTKGPLDEAPFMQRTGVIYGSITKSDGSSGLVNTDGTGYAVNANIAEATTPWVFNVGYSSEDTDYSGFVTGGIESTALTLGIGYYIQQNTQLIFYRVGSENKSKTGSFKFTADANIIYAHTVILMDRDTALALSGQYTALKDSDSDKYTEYEISGDYYLSRYMGIGLLYSKRTSSRGYLENSTTGVHFSMYFTQKFNIDLSYSTTAYDASTDTSNLKIGAYLQF